MDRVLVFFIASLFTVTVVLILLGASYLIISKWKKINLFSVKVQKHGVYFVLGRRNKIDQKMVSQKIAENEYNLTKAEEDKYVESILASKEQLKPKTAGS